jgi:hypothetical protein
MFRLYLRHLQALKGQTHTVSEQCIVGSPALTINWLYNAEILRVAVLPVLGSFALLSYLHLTQPPLVTSSTAIHRTSALYNQPIVSVR